MGKIYQVYVSSTLVDLEPERDQAMKWLIQSGHLPVHSYRPDSDTVRDSCLADIDRCDVYVLIMGHRYGFIPQTDDNAERLSITHLEYRRAVQRDMPRVVLLRKNVPDIRLTDWGDEQRMKQLDAFRQEVSAQSRPSEFPDLAHFVKDLSTGVQRAIDKLAAPSPAVAPSPVTQPVPRPVLRLPLHPIIGRDELVNAVVAGLDAGRRHFAFEFLPGVGKTAVAAKLVRTKAVTGRFPDGVLWAHLGEDPDIQRQLEKWAKALGIDDDTVRSCVGPEALSGLLEGEIADRSMLLVIDDVWTSQAGRYFNIGGEHSACVLTTRHSQVSRDLSTAQGVIKVRKLSPEQSFELLREIAPDAAALEPEALRKLAGHVDGLPIGLVLIGNRLKKARNRNAIQAVLQSVSDIYTQDKPADDKEVSADMNRFRDRRLDELIEASYKTLGSAGAMNPDALDGDTLRQALQGLSVLRPDPAWFNARLASVVTQAPARALDDLADAGLIEPYDLESGSDKAPDDDRYTVHRVIAAFVRKKLPEATFRELNRRVADHYLGEMQELEQRFQEDGSNYRAMYRYEDPQWTHCQDNWLYYLARTGNDAEGGLAFLRAWFEGFWWWSCFTEEGFDFCDQLLREWDHRVRLKLAATPAPTAPANERVVRSNRGLDLLRRFKLAYPKEFPRGGGRLNGSWQTVAETLLELRFLVGIEGGLSALASADARLVRALTDVFLAEAARFDRKDFSTAEIYYRESLQLFREAKDHWNVAWLLYHLSDMFSSCGREADLRPLCEEALSLGLNSSHPDYEVVSNVYRVLGDADLHAGRVAESGRHYQLAVEYAYRFQVEPEEPDDYTVQFYADIAQQVAGRLLETPPTHAGAVADVARGMRQAWLDRGATLGAGAGAESLLQTGSADELTAWLFPAKLPLDRLAPDGAAYAARVRRELQLEALPAIAETETEAADQR